MQLGHRYPGQRDVQNEREGRQVCDDEVPALGLEVHLKGEGEDEGEDDWDEPEGEGSCHGCDGHVLAEEAEYRGREDEERE